MDETSLEDDLRDYPLVAFGIFMMIMGGGLMIIGVVISPFAGDLEGIGIFVAICGAIALSGWYAKAPEEKKPIQEEVIPEVPTKLPSITKPTRSHKNSPQAGKGK